MTTVTVIYPDGREEVVGWMDYPVPTHVTPLQMRRALRVQNMTEIVKAYLSGAEESLIEEWEYATQIDRDNEFIARAAADLGLTNEQVDDLFRFAAMM